MGTEVADGRTATESVTRHAWLAASLAAMELFLDGVRRYEALSELAMRSDRSPNIRRDKSATKRRPVVRVAVELACRLQRTASISRFTNRATMEAAAVAHSRDHARRRHRNQSGLSRTTSFGTEEDGGSERACHCRARTSTD